MNRCIPDDFVFVKEETKNTVSYNKKQIEEFISFDDKIKKILPQVRQKDFVKQVEV